MSLFDDRLEEYLGAADRHRDIRAMVRSAWFYDFDGVPVRVWQGQGRLYTADGNTWLGTVPETGQDVHQTPRVKDGRDGTSPNYEFSFGYLDEATYLALTREEDKVEGRTLTRYRVLFQPGEGLRPETPIKFAKAFTMFSALFNEQLVIEGTSLRKRYTVTILAKDDNSGRSHIPNRTYTSTSQKAYAASLGVTNDKGCDFIAGLNGRTFKFP